MKEKIYTIPVTEAFNNDCECPLCLLVAKLETDYVESSLGASLMEPDIRATTNSYGFCRRHFESLYNSHLNVHGFGLVIDTYLQSQIETLNKMYKAKSSAIKKDTKLSVIGAISNKVSKKQTETDKFIDEMLAHLKDHEGKCAICSKIEYTMSRYIDVIFHLWSSEKEFINLFNSKKGFCLKHFKQLLKGSKKHLNSSETAVFVTTLMEMQLKNMTELQKDVHWFTEKFDYRNIDAPWGNSKDAVSRSVEKIVGNCHLE